MGVPPAGADSPVWLVPQTQAAAGPAALLEEQGSTTAAAYTCGNSLIRRDGEVPLYDGLGTARSQTNSGQAVTSTLTPRASVALRPSVPPR